MKVLRGERELSEKDVEEIPKGLIPGEWISLEDKASQKKYIAYINPYSEIFFKIKIIMEIQSDFNLLHNEKEIAEEIISKLLRKSIEKRNLFLGYEAGARLVYGANDFLPGLIVDKYQKYILIQVNTAGLDRFRELIKKIIEIYFPSQQVVFFDNEEYRKAEVLPIHIKEGIENDLEVSENGLNYKIPKSVMQKVGYYYDHRENRIRLKNLLSRLNIKKESALDLFSYVGSWGLHLLAAGVAHVEFVDQGQMQNTIEENLKINGFAGRGSFTRADVFKFLDLANSENKKYDIIISDPPAFTKSEKNKINALQGYEKLHTKALRVISDGGIFVAASCTHYVGYDELDKTVQEAAFKNGQKLRLLDLGTQGFDHPMTGLKDKSFYIKYLAYHVTRGSL